MIGTGRRNRAERMNASNGVLSPISASATIPVETRKASNRSGARAGVRGEEVGVQGQAGVAADPHEKSLRHRAQHQLAPGRRVCGTAPPTARARRPAHGMSLVGTRTRSPARLARASTTVSAGGLPTRRTSGSVP